MQFLEKLSKMLHNVEILNLSQQQKKNYLASKPNYHTTKFITERFIRNRRKKI